MDLLLREGMMIYPPYEERKYMVRRILSIFNFKDYNTPAFALVLSSMFTLVGSSYFADRQIEHTATLKAAVATHQTRQN